jgi:hypothetical protein
LGGTGQTQQENQCKMPHESEYFPLPSAWQEFDAIIFRTQVCGKLHYGGIEALQISDNTIPLWAVCLTSVF